MEANANHIIPHTIICQLVAVSSMVLLGTVSHSLYLMLYFIIPYHFASNANFIIFLSHLQLLLFVPNVIISLISFKNWKCVVSTIISFFFNDGNNFCEVLDMSGLCILKCLFVDVNKRRITPFQFNVLWCAMWEAITYS